MIPEFLPFTSFDQNQSTYLSHNFYVTSFNRFKSLYFWEGWWKWLIDSYQLHVHILQLWTHPILKGNLDRTWFRFPSTFNYLYLGTLGWFGLLFRICESENWIKFKAVFWVFYFPRIQMLRKCVSLFNCFSE